MQTRSLGTTGLVVSAVGLGAGRLGGADLADADVDRLVGRALDLGVTLLDTAPSYGRSEERLGRALQTRRDAVVLSTKLGYGVPGLQDWTGPAVAAGVDAALARLGTDRLDVAHLHSCGTAVLRDGDVVEALLRSVEAGKVRVAAYSGDGEPLQWAVRSGAFGAVQCSVSVLDQANLSDAIPEASRRGMGVLAKRPLADAPWRFSVCPASPDVALYWDRLAAWGALPEGFAPTELFLRFAAYAEGVSSALVGTASPAHLEEAVRAVERGPLDAELLRALLERFRRIGGDWVGQV
jgi:aryl-alcohol dehydrogenase-like predicted oxidoreductase